MTSSSRTQTAPAARERRTGPAVSAEAERRLEAFLLIARRVGLS